MKNFKVMFTVLVSVLVFTGVAFGDNNTYPWPQSGNIGIGTANSGYKLTVSTTTLLDGIFNTDGTRWMKYMAGTVDSGSYNGIVQVNDNAIIYSGGAQGTGSFVIAPWASATSGIRLDSSGNVGIGISAPTATLHINQPSGKYGFSNPYFQYTYANTWNVLYMYMDNQGNQHISTGQNPISIGNLAFDINGNQKMIILNNGNVGIGKIPGANYLLDVNGSIRANKIVVNTTGADFVFNDNYKLTPLSEVEKYIESNKHLPDFPSAKEMQQKGADVGDMQVKLLAKVEELTLHMIEQEKKLAKQDKRIASLEIENAKLKKEKNDN